jgi:hypothetical protein
MCQENSLAKIVKSRIILSQKQIEPKTQVYTWQNEWKQWTCAEAWEES